MPIVGQIFEYCLARAAVRYGIKVHAYCVMSNHYHIVASDPDGNLPDFMSWLNEFIAKVLNRVWDRGEHFWGPGTYSAVRLETPDDIIEKTVYTLTNPVKALLVSDASNWPGCTSRTQPFGRDKTFIKPTVFFRKTSPLPKRVIMLLSVPDCFQDSPAEFKTKINQQIKTVENDFKRNALKHNRYFAGRDEVKKMKPDDTPRSAAPRRNLNPHVASKNAIALKRALRRLKWFRLEYEVARQRLNRGETGVIFPFGTYYLRKLVALQPNPPPEDSWLE